MITIKNKKKKPKISSHELMEMAVDKELLEKRKKEAEAKNSKPKKVEEIEIEREKEWWELPMDKSKFKVKSHEGMFYGHYETWKSNIWIGPYESRKEINAVIKSYVEETSKPQMERDIKNVHSILIEL